LTALGFFVGQEGKYRMNLRRDAAVIVVGAGPAGLMLANELGRREVATLVLEAAPSTSTHPRANATQARTMEYFRRLGIADRIRAQGLPPDYPTDVAYFTRYTGHELARFQLPSSAEARELARRLTGSWSAAELPHRCSQLFIECVMREAAESLALRHACLRLACRRLPRGKGRRDRRSGAGRGR